MPARTVGCIPWGGLLPGTSIPQGGGGVHRESQESPRAFFAILYKYGYDGYLSNEPHSPTWTGEKGEKGLKYTIKYIRGLMILD